MCEPVHRRVTAPRFKTRILENRFRLSVPPACCWGHFAAAPLAWSFFRLALGLPLSPARGRPYRPACDMRHRSFWAVCVYSGSLHEGHVHERTEQRTRPERTHIRHGWGRHGKHAPGRVGRRDGCQCEATCEIGGVDPGQSTPDRAARVGML